MEDFAETRLSPPLPTIHPEPEARLVVEVDDRENRGGVMEALRQLPKVEVRLVRLKVGDYRVGNRCTLERKTLPDFALSLVDGRLFRQACRLQRCEGAIALILEGRWSALAASQISRESLQGAWVCLSVLFGLPILRSLDAAETARLVVYAGRQLERRGTQGVLSRRGWRPRGTQARRLFVLQGLPGVGPRRAAQLLEHFGSIAGVIRATRAELAALPGIGPAIAGKIATVLGE